MRFNSGKSHLIPFARVTTVSSEQEASRSLPQRKFAVKAAVLLRRLEAGAILLASFALAAFVVARKAQVEHLLSTLGPFAMPLAVLVLAIVASAPFSVTDALAVMNGVIFGPWWGSVVNALGIVLAAVIGYVVALRTSALLDIEAQVQKLPPWVRRFKIGSPMFLICVRVIPGLGGTIATQTAAALRVPIFRQVYTMCAIAVPICTALAVGGNFLSSYIESHVVRPAEAYVEKHHIYVRLPHPHHVPPRRVPSPAP
jgi:uncharacterized membrane protein YdjX (TVP38/TMEM64 family)